MLASSISEAQVTPLSLIGTGIKAGYLCLRNKPPILSPAIINKKKLLWLLSSPIYSLPSPLCLNCPQTKTNPPLYYSSPFLQNRVRSSHHLPSSRESWLQLCCGASGADPSVPGEGGGPWPQAGSPWDLQSLLCLGVYISPGARLPG